MTKFCLFSHKLCRNSLASHQIENNCKPNSFVACKYHQFNLRTKQRYSCFQTRVHNFNDFFSIFFAQFHHLSWFNLNALLCVVLRFQLNVPFISPMCIAHAIDGLCLCVCVCPTWIRFFTFKKSSEFIQSKGHFVASAVLQLDDVRYSVHHRNTVQKIHSCFSLHC